MPLLGSAAMLLSFDVAPVAIAEHDDWHTHEHLPERLSIRGFLRGSRWRAVRGEPRYQVLYEVSALETLTSAPYLERLNRPSAWTAKMMPHYRAMRRGLCVVAGSFGTGLGGIAWSLRFTPRVEFVVALRRWLLDDVLPALPVQRGIGSAHLLEGASTAPMTNEQRIRGADAAVDSVLLLRGYDEDALSAVSAGVLARPELERRGATDVVEGLYRMDYAMIDGDVRA